MSKDWRLHCNKKQTELSRVCSVISSRNISWSLSSSSIQVLQHHVCHIHGGVVPGIQRYTMPWPGSPKRRGLVIDPSGDMGIPATSSKLKRLERNISPRQLWLDDMNAILICWYYQWNDEEAKETKWNPWDEWRPRLTRRFFSIPDDEPLSHSLLLSFQSKNWICWLAWTARYHAFHNMLLDGN